MKDFNIYVEGMGFGDTYSVKAKDLKSAKAKARKKAIRDFASTLKAYKEV
jgi:hypothetical protein